MFQKTLLSRYISVGLLQIAIPAAYAAESTKPTGNIPTIVIEASKQTEADAKTLDKAAIADKTSAVPDTASLLKNFPGVTINQAGGVSSLPAIHGLADDRLRIQIDGMDQISSCPNHMNPPLSTIAPSQVNEIKVYPGISPVSLGGDSIGGTIIVDSNKAEFAKESDESVFKGQWSLLAESNNNALSSSVTVSQATQKATIQYDGNWSKADNYHAADSFKASQDTGVPGHSLDSDEVGSTAYDLNTHKLNVRLKAEEGLWDISLGYQNIPEQLYPNQRMDLLDNEQKSGKLAYTHMSDWGETTVSVYHEQVDHFMDFGDDKRFWYGAFSNPDGHECSPIGPKCATGMPMYSEGKTSGFKLHNDYYLNDRDLLKAGVEIQLYSLDDYWKPSGGGMWPNTFWNINDGQRDRYAAFVELESELDAQWKTLIGLRYEQVRSDADEAQGYNDTKQNPTGLDASTFNALDHDVTDHNIDFTALATYHQSETFDMEFGFARKIRSPNLYERYTWSSWTMAALMNNFVGDGNGYVGNLDLDPEKAYTLSATLNWHSADQNWNLSVQPFYTHVTDYVDAVATGAWSPDAFNVLTYDNQTARLYGMDISFGMPLANNTAGDWKLSGNINYVNGENTDTGDGLYNIMPLNALLAIDHNYHQWHNRLELELVDDKKSLSEVRNELDTGGYSLLHWKANWREGPVRLDFGVTNLLDRSYDLPTGGVYLGQGTTMQKTGVPYGVAVPGAGRSFYAGVNVDF